MFDEREVQVLAASLTVVLVCLFLRRSYKQNGVKDDGKRYPPSVAVLPLFRAIIRGGMLEVPKHFMKKAEKLGPVLSFTIGKRLAVVLNDYDAIFDAMVKHSEAFADRQPMWTEMKILNPELRGIVYSHYDEAYKKYKRLALSILKEFGFGVHRVSETLILKEVETMNEEILKQNGRPFDPKWLLTFTTANVTLSIVFGKNFLQAMPKDYSTIVKSTSEVMENIDMTVNMAPIVRFLPMFSKKMDILRKHGKKLLDALEVAIEFIKSNRSDPSFVRRFLETEGNNYDHQDLLYLMRDLCFGSTDTVSTTLQWAVVELANNPDVLGRFQREIDETVPEERLPSLDDKPRMPYTEAVILEIMRRRTVGPILIPHGTLKDTKVLEYDVPKGSLIIGNAYGAHMDPKLWEDPENFRPERFLDKDNNVINSQRMIGFGLGKRSCPGELIARQTVFLFVTSLVQRFDIRPPEGQKTINVTELSSLTMYPSHFEVRLIPREKSTHGSD